MKWGIKRIFNFFWFKIPKINTNKDISFFNDYNRKLGYEFENDANEIIKTIRKFTMLPYVNLVTLYEQVLYCEKNNIRGAFVECGVWKGGATALMASANIKIGLERRNIHLFDAFEEICAPDIESDGVIAINEVKQILGDKALINGELTPLKGIYDAYGGPGNLAECQSLFENVVKYPSDKVFFHKGWFQETLPVESKKIESIAILRLDGDWYESTKICLRSLYDKVVPGGFIIIDDYGLYTGCKNAVDEFFTDRKISVYLNYSSWACRYIIKN
jgi:hypothetical protein